tara:strand:- start:807 stop:1397 length:591 start_codon:yes stop_codon:yes gene_type:complete
MDNLYISQSLTFESDKITIDGFGYEVMMDWEHPIMSGSAAYVTENGGDILEIGFGMGISAGYIQSHSIDSHTIVENHPQIIAKAVEWASNKSNVTIISQSWMEWVDEVTTVENKNLPTYDGIFYDTSLDDDIVYFSSSLSELTKTGTKLSVFNSFSSETNDHNIEMNYKQINVSTPNSASQYFNNDNVYYMPMKEF